jgi:hypothetical protein
MDLDGTRPHQHPAVTTSKHASDGFFFFLKMEQEHCYVLITFEFLKMEQEHCYILSNGVLVCRLMRKKASGDLSTGAPVQSGDELSFLVEEARPRSWA